MHISSALILYFGITLIGAHPESRQTFTKSTESDGSLKAFLNAINHGSIQVVQEMIGNRNVNEGDENGVTALHVAAIKGIERMANLLIENGGNVTSKTNKGETPLHVASNNGNEKLAKLLIKNGADVNAVDQNGVSSLQLAVFENYKRVVDLLIQSGANVNHQDNEGKSVLHWAAPKASAEVAELLISGGATSVSVQDKFGKTPLFYANLAGNNEFVVAIKNFLASGCRASSHSVALLLSTALCLMLI